MRGGVDAHTLMCDTDLEDLSVIDKIVKENIELTKQTNMPMI